MSKQQIRKEIGQKRKVLNNRWLEDASVSIVEHLRVLDIYETAKTVALYKAISGEVFLEPLFSECWGRGKRTCIPVYNAEIERYELAEITSNTCFKIGRYDVQEPVTTDLAPVEMIDLMVIPGVAFDLNGNRLGRGGGYYDRLLQHFSGKIVAVCFDFQVINHVPVDKHDIPVDFLITETKCIKV